MLNLNDREKAMVLERLFEFSEDCFLIVDADGRITGINDAYYQDFRVSLYKPQEELMGMQVQEVFYQSNLPAMLRKKEKTSVMDTFYAGENSNLDPDKYGYNIRTCANIFDREGRIMGAIAHVRTNRQTGLMEEMLEKAEREIRYYQKQLSRLTSEAYSYQEIAGVSPAIMRVKNEMARAAATDFNVMLTGETGTGKELFASALHNGSERRERPFVKINCSAIPAELFESELFGYEEGAFTGAQKGGKAGKFEQANGGTIFLDEIADMPMQMQAKLLRVLQEQEVDRLGGTRSLKIDVRVIAATNKDLEKCIRAHTFRADLYYRLNVISIHIPPLRERREDIPELAEKFLKQLNDRYGTQKKIAASAMEELKSRHWRGNVRELKNTVERMFAFSDGNLMLEASALSADDAPCVEMLQPERETFLNMTLSQRVEHFERSFIVEILERTHFNYKKAAEELQISRGTLYNRIEKYHIQRPRAELDSDSKEYNDGRKE